MTENFLQRLARLREAATYGPMTFAIKCAAPIRAVLPVSGRIPSSAVFWAGVSPYGAPAIQTRNHLRSGKREEKPSDVYDRALKSLADIYVRRHLRSGIDGLKEAAGLTATDDERLAMLGTVAWTGYCFQQVDALEFAVAAGLPLARRIRACGVRFVLAQSAIWELKGEVAKAADMLHEYMESEIGDNDPFARALMERALGHLELCKSFRATDHKVRFSILDRAAEHLERADRLHTSACVPSEADASLRRSEVELAYINWRRSGDASALARLGPFTESCNALTSDARLLELLLRLNSKGCRLGSAKRLCHSAIKQLRHNKADQCWQAMASPKRAMLLAVLGVILSCEAKPGEALPAYKDALRAAQGCGLAEARACELYGAALAKLNLLPGAAHAITQLQANLRDRAAMERLIWPAVEDDDLWRRAA